MAVSYLEQSWYDEHRHKLLRLAKDIYITRHVDNRLVLSAVTASHRHRTFNSFCPLSFIVIQWSWKMSQMAIFWVQPCVPQNARSRLSFRQPTEPFQFRPINFAGTLPHKLSAALARICLASRKCFSSSQAKKDVQILICHLPTEWIRLRRAFSPSTTFFSIISTDV